jgi:hypothetical protein
VADEVRVLGATRGIDGRSASPEDEGGNGDVSEGDTFANEESAGGDVGFEDCKAAIKELVNQGFKLSEAWVTLFMSLTKHRELTGLL